MKMIKCIIDGKVVELTEAAAAIAKEYYGAVTEADIIKMKPQEISRPIIRPATPPVVVEGEVKKKPVKRVKK